MLTCRCGAVMVSDGKVWSCPISKQDTYLFEPEAVPKLERDGRGQLVMKLIEQRPIVRHTYDHSPDVEDHRMTVDRSVSVDRPCRQASGSSRTYRSKPVLHKGKMACCEACNPDGYIEARRRELAILGARRG